MTADILLSNSTNSTSEYVILTADFHGLAAPALLFFWFLLVGLAKVAFEKIHSSSHIYEFIKKFPESCILIFLGLIVGFILPDDKAEVVKSVFTNHNFFIYILPPIIFEAGYTVPMRPFANNATEIGIYAIIGTLLNTILVGGTLIACDIWNTGLDQPWLADKSFIDFMGMLHYFLYAAIISAVDPVAVLAVFDQVHVNTTLYILVFGESLMNDGVAVVLFQVFEQLLKLDEGLSLILVVDILLHFCYIVLGGVIIGIIFGLATALITKYTHYAKMMEPIVVFGMAYLSYLVAEGFKTSAILSLVFCALSMRFYVHHNMAHESNESIHNTGMMLAYLTEATIFLNLGIGEVRL